MVDVGCAGILVADMFCGPLDTLPEPGELLALDSMPTMAGGCAANVAIGLAKQGISANVIGCLGQDAAAQIVTDALQEAGVATNQIVYVGEHTSQTVALLVRGEDRRYLHMFGANKALSVQHISHDVLRTYKLFYVGGLYVLPGIKPDELTDRLRFCREQGILTMVDVVLPKDRQHFDDMKHWLPYVDYFVPNDDEARQITTLEDPRQQARALIEMGARNVVITAGEKGVFAFSQGHSWRASAFQVESIDMSGGGDAFSAGLITGILRGWDMPRSLHYASALGASATLAIGTTPGVFTAAQAESFLQSHHLEIVEE